jgi:hypothetical protein
MDTVHALAKLLAKSIETDRPLLPDTRAGGVSS